MPKATPTKIQNFIEVDAYESCACAARLLWLLCWFIFIATFPFSLAFCMKTVMEHERIVVLRLGRLLGKRAKGPGMVLVLPCIDDYVSVDLRSVSMVVPPQEILTRDSVTVTVDAVVYYRVSDPIMATTNIEDAHSSTRLLAQTTLRNILGMRSLAEILCQRDAIVTSTQAILDEATDSWGIKVERVEMMDVRIPYNLQRAMAAEAEAAREAKAKVVAAEGERKASKSLREAAQIVSEQSGALQLRYLQALSTLSSEENQTMVFPLPVDLIKLWVERIENETNMLKQERSRVEQVRAELERLKRTLGQPTTVGDKGAQSGAAAAAAAKKITFGETF